jgi:hypothetical protein
VAAAGEIIIEHDGVTWTLEAADAYLILRRPHREGEVEGEENVVWLEITEDCGHEGTSRLPD